MIVLLTTDHEKVDLGVVIKCCQSQRHNLLGFMIVDKYVDSHFAASFKHLDLV